jgi:hypothetical protein
MRAKLATLLLALVLQPASANLYAAENGSPISDLYSDIDMRLKLSIKADAAACDLALCEVNQAFDARVSAIGRYLVKAATMLYPQQTALIQHMTFFVADKKDAGTASNNKGNIIVFRGVQHMQLSDDALGYVIAREMGHVLNGHHITNTSTKLIISAVASIVFPAVAIIGASSTAAQASTATSLVTSAASTATSMLGGEIAMAKMKPTQLQKADEIAYHIMEKVEWDMRSANSVLTQGDMPTGAWMLDLEQSRIQLEKMIEAEEATIELLPEDISQQTTLQADTETKIQ